MVEAAAGACRHRAEGDGGERGDEQHRRRQRLRVCARGCPNRIFLFVADTGAQRGAIQPLWLSHPRTATAQTTYQYLTCFVAARELARCHVALKDLFEVLCEQNRV